jgi:hypothetical protein
MKLLLRLVESKGMKIQASIRVRRVVGVILLVCGLQLSGQQTVSGAEAEAKAATYIPFDPPGSHGTSPVAINPAGTITGYYWDAHGKTHGLLRIPARQDDDTEGDSNESDNAEGGND